MLRSIVPVVAPLFGLLLACGDDSPSGSGEATTSGSSGAASTGLAEGTTGASTGTADNGTADSTGEPPPDLPTPIQCDPEGGGPYWTLEGELLAVPITCATGLELPGIELSIDPMPPGAIYNPATATLLWTPGLDQAAGYELEITALPYGETGTVKIGVLDRWDDPANTPVVDSTIYTEEYGLPVLHLTTAPEISSSAYTPATIVYRGHTYVAEAKLRGAASLNYPKNSYTLKFTKEDKFSEPDRAGGFLDKRKVVLISTFDDNAYVRQRLAYELWNRLDPDHIQVQVYSGILFLDGQYYGLYTFSDHVDEYLMEDHGLHQLGNLYKARTHDANFRLTRANGQPKSSLHQGLTKEEGLPVAGQPGDYDDLDELVSFVATASDQDFLAELDTRIDRRDYEDWWIFVSLIMGDDSAGKNSYHYHDPSTGPWRFVPWDFNDSFGQTWQTARKGFTTSPESYTWANHLFTRMLAAPGIGDPLRARYGAALHGVYDVTEVLALMDAMVDETASSARRDEGRWGAQYITYGGWSWRSDFLTYEEEVVYLRQWIEDRWAHVDGLY